jgi:hypothetical protein
VDISIASKKVSIPLKEGQPRPISGKQFAAQKANSSRGGDAKPEVSQGREIARLPGSGFRSSLRQQKEDTRMYKFKLRHTKLLLSIAALVALVVDAGAGFKF